MSTVFASITTPGPAGPPGRTALWLTGTVAPVTAQGLDGDMYLNDTNGDVYGPKNVTWGGVVANIQGVPGGPGPAGPIGYSPLYIVAPGVPSNATGNNGDMYLNNTTSDLYGPKAVGAWGGIVANIRGTQGPPGVAYTPRGAWNSATTYVQGDMVSDGNIVYIALQSANLNHVPLTSPTWWQAAAQGSSQWVTIGSDIYYNTGKVGIGTASPAATLQVRTGVNRNFGITSALSAGLAGIGIQSYNDAASVYQPLEFAGSAYIFGAAGGAGGNVGIGTSTPQAPLHVVINTAATDVFSGAVLLLKNIDPTVGNGCAIQGQNAGGGVTSEIRFINTGAALYPNNAGAIAFSTYAGGGAAGTEKMRITPSGNVGIGTTSPQTGLHVTKDGAGLTGMDLAQCYIGGTDGNKRLVLAYDTTSNVGFIQSFIFGGAITPLSLQPSGGNVGIGTAAPLSRLAVINGSDPAAVVDAGQITIYESVNRAAYKMRMGFFWNSPIGQWTGLLQSTNNGSGGPLLLNPEGGTVGIGTNNPAGTLHVNAASGIHQTYLSVTAGLDCFLYLGSTANGLQGGFQVDGAGNLSTFHGGIAASVLMSYRAGAVANTLVLNAGKVGIGTTAPLSQLSIIPAGTVTTVAQAQTLTIGESSNNPGWRLSLGYVNNGANWRGCIQATETGVAGGLLLNPSGGAVGVGLMAPVYALDVTGDVNCTGSFRVNGTPIGAGGGVTVRSTVIGGGITRALGTVYRNTTGKPLMITVAVLIIAGATYTLNTDANTNPSTVAASSAGNAGAACPCLTCWVLPNHYYTASVSSGATTIYSWNEWY